MANAVRLDFSSTRTLGRSAELETLVDTYSRVSDPAAPVGSSEIVMVAGYSGVGKTTLVEQLRQYVLDTHNNNNNNNNNGGGYFVSGKFNRHRGTEPYAELANALTELCDLLQASCKEGKVCAASIKEEVGAEGKFLTKAIPELRQIIGEEQSGELTTNKAAGSTNVGNREAFHRLKAVFKTFVRTVCRFHPVVLCLEDLQWADVESLLLIKALVTDAKSKNFLFVGSYRDNEIDDKHHLAIQMQNIEQEGTPITKIQLGNLDSPTVNQLISDVTKLDCSETQPLTDVVYRKTYGNIFFVIQFLKLLQEEGLLYFSLKTYKWTWDMDHIASDTSISDNVVDIVADKIQRLPQDVQAVLMIAASLWSTFNVEVLEYVMREVDMNGCWGPQGMSNNPSCFVKTKEDLVEKLDIAADEGLVEKCIRSRYRFAHDRIQQGAYTLIPEGDGRDLLHFRIGELLWEMSSSPCGQGKEWVLFAAADQLNRGSICITDEKKRVDLARLNLRVGELARSKSAFMPAADYLMSGIRLLDGTNKWEQHYDLSLKLHNAAAETEYCSGNFERSWEALDEVLVSGRNLQDKFISYFTLVDLLGAQQNLDDAMEVGFDVLAQLGERFPKRVTNAHVMKDLRKTKKMLQGRTDDELLALPVMEDENKVAAMRLLNSLALYTVFDEQVNRSALLTFRRIQLLLCHGVSRQSPSALAQYGSILVMFGDFKEGYKFGQLALKLLDRLNAKESVAVVYKLVYFLINVWHHPFQDSLEPLLRAHEVGMECGAIESAFQVSTAYCGLYYFCGLRLVPVEGDMRAFCKQMEEYKQNATWRFTLPLWQAVLNFMGRSDDPLKLTGEAMDQDVFIKEAVKSNHKIALNMVWFQRMLLGYYFGDLELASEMSEKVLCKEFKIPIMVQIFTWFDGLISVELARKTRKRKYRVRVRRCIKTMEKWAKGGAVNCLHKLLLLQAEYGSFTYDGEKARKAYDRAISTASKAGFLQDAALANERAGILFLKRGDEFWASSYLARSHDLYREWGAQAKANQLTEQHSMVFKVSDPEFSSHFRSRGRFTEKISDSHRKVRIEDPF